MADADARNAVWIRSVVGRYEQPLLRYVTRLLDDLEAARDVVQEAFLRLWERPEAGADHVAEWLFTVCRNRALNVLRKERRMKFLSDEFERTHASREASPQAAAQDNELAGRLGVLLAGLSPRQEEIVRLKFQNGFSYKQIAGITGLTVSNVGFILHVAMRTLREKFQAAGLLEKG